MIKHIFLILLFLLALMLWHPAIAQTSLPACTTNITDNDSDGVVGTMDIDKDGDGLIELCDFEGLNEMRYQLDGSGYRRSADATAITDGCPVSGCRGYELVINLDSTASGSYRNAINTAWTMAPGWQPIGSTAAPFNSVFEGNGHTISNLLINRPDEDYVGLFAAVAGSIQGIRLLAADIKGRHGVGGITSFAITGSLIVNSSVEGSVEGSDAWIGGLVGENYGSIISSYVKGDVTGHTNVGGLVGYSVGLISNSYASVDVEAIARSGGLVGYNQNPGTAGGRITNSYAAGSVQSSFSVGGLVGYNDSGMITDVYASGDVIGSVQVGGLVGYNDAGGSISNGYALGVVSGGTDAGGLVGYNTIDSSIINSYWDVEASGIKTSAGGTPKTTAQLQAAPASDLYVSWLTDNWEFGSEGALQYPYLKYGNIQGHTTCGDPLPACGSLLADQDQPGNQGQLALQTLTLSSGVLEPPFDPTMTYYEIVDIPTDHTTVTVTVMANDDSATITIDGDSVSTKTPLLTDIGSTELTGIEIVLTDMDRTKHYTIVLPPQPALPTAPTDACFSFGSHDIDRDDDGLIDICDLEGLYAIRYQLDGSGYKRSVDANRSTVGCRRGGCRGYELVRNLDFDDSAHYLDSNNRPIWRVDDYDDITDRGWRPIGNSANPFNAIFNGNGYTISNLAINREDTNYVGLFGSMTSAAKIVATELLDAKVHGKSLVGGLVGNNDGGTIEHSHVRGDKANVEGSDILVGGLVGSHRGRINNSYALGTVLGNQSVGGLAGASYRTASTIINSYALNNVEGRTFVGGLMGANIGSLSNSYSDGMVEGIINVGGLVGLNVGNIDNSYANSDVTGIESSNIVGGLVGENRGVVENSYSSGEVNGQDSVGGLVGINSGSIADSYWDKEVSGRTMSAGSADANGLLTNELQVSELFSGWLSAHWNFAAGRYPILKYIVGDDGANPACYQNRSDNVNTELPLCDTALFYQIPIMLTGEIGGMAQANEGGTLVLTAPTVIAGKGNYRYVWTNNSELSLGKRLVIRDNNAITSNVRIPVDFIAADATSSDIIFTLEVSDDTNTVSRQKVVTINKIDNSEAEIDIIRETSRTLMVKVGSDPDGDATDPGYTYRWQWLGKSVDAEWMDIEGATDASYTITDKLADILNEFRIIVTYTDGQGYPERLSFELQYALVAPCTADIADTDNDNIYNEGAVGIIDIDKDGDGLIEICDLDGLNEVRYQLEGESYKKDDDADPITDGCPSGRCIGYELVKDLDFNDENNYRSPRSITSNKVDWTSTTKTGWNPIGGGFLGLFDGNDYTISNLYINRGRAQGIGLFSQLGKSGPLASHLVETIKNVGLLNVNIAGDSDVGGLVGQNSGSIINNYVMGGTVTGNDNNVGGLVGVNNSRSFVISSFADVEVGENNNVGGLAGTNNGLISHSYATGDVKGSSYVGGLIGDSSGEIINSYAAGDVTGTGSVLGLGGLVGNQSSGASIKNTYAAGDVIWKDGSSVGGLVGWNWGAITNSYVIGTESPESREVAGLVDDNEEGFATITASYWDNNRNESSSEYGEAKTTSELQSPTAAPSTDTTAVYYGWSRDDWDFGDNKNYPALRYSKSSDEDACNPDVTISPPLPPCTIPLYNQPIRTKGLAGVFFLSDNKATMPSAPPLFSPLIFSYPDVKIEIPGVNTNIQLRPYAINSPHAIDSTAIISITEQGDTTTNYFDGKVSGELSAPIPLDRAKTLTIVVTDITDEGTTTETTYTFDMAIVLKVSQRIIPSGTIDEGSTATIIFEVIGGTGDYNYQYLLDNKPLLPLGQPFLYRIPADIVGRDAITKAVNLEIMVDDGAGQSIEHTEPLTVRKVNNLQPGIVFDINPSWLRVRLEEPDADGEGSFTSLQWQRRDLRQEWTDIPLATTTTYWLPAGVSGDIRYRVIDMSYQDGQGYDQRYTEQGPVRASIDDDDDGLIDLYYLEDLDAIRNQPDGRGYKRSMSTDLLTLGCPLVGGEEHCRGYELRRNLDFTVASSYQSGTVNTDWTGTKGWSPMPSSGDFSAIFDGNGYTISNLRINDDTRSNVGLFRSTSETTIIKNVGLLDVAVEGDTNVGALSGRSVGNIINSYVTGTVVGAKNVGGLVGQNNGQIISSFVNTAVEGSVNYIGGLVGVNNGVIENTYTGGSVTSGGLLDPPAVGGLVGDNGGSIKNSYTISVATVASERNDLLGGLVGSGDGSSIYSYWDNEVSMQPTRSAGGTSKTTAELQSPTAPSTDTKAVYYGWSSDAWDFGNSQQYPTLRYAKGDDLDACTTNITILSVISLCDALLPHQPIRKGLAAIFFLKNDAAATTVTSRPLFSSSTDSYDVAIVIPEHIIPEHVDPDIRLRPLAINNDATITINKQGVVTNYFDGKSNGQLSDSISLEDNEATLTVKVTDTIDESTTKTDYTFAIKRLMREEIPPLKITVSSQPEANLDRTINEGSITTLTLTTLDRRDIMSFNYDYEWIQTAGKTLTLTDINNAALEVAIPADFVALNEVTTDTTFKVVVSDGFSTTSRSVVMTIAKIDNGNVAIKTDADASRLSVSLVEPEPDGEGDFSLQWQSQVPQEEWMDIAGATTATYWLPARADDSRIRYRAIGISYTDGQGYKTEYDNQGPFPGAIEATDEIGGDAQTNEGGTLVLTAPTVSGGSEVYSYEWIQIAGKIFTLTAINAATLEVAIPADFVALNADTTDTTFKVVVNDGFTTTSLSKVVTIAKIPNGSSAIKTDVDASRLRVSLVAPDPDGEGDFSLQWQSQVPQEGWMNITDATTATYWLPANADDSRIRYRAIGISYTDGQGYVASYDDQGPFPGAIESTSEIGGDAQADEGKTLALTAPTVSGGSEVYSYAWTYSAEDSMHLSGKSELAVTGTTATTLNVAIPADFIALDPASTKFTFKVVVNDGFTTVERSTEVTIVKINNSSIPAIKTDADASRLSVSLVAPDPDGEGDFSLQWQSQVPQEGWMNITGATTATYRLPADRNQRIRYRAIGISYTDGQGYVASYDDQGPFPGAIESTSEIGGEARADEGETLVLTAPTVSGGSEVYSYEWTYSAEDSMHLSGKSELAVTGTDAATLNVVIPTDFIALDPESTTFTFKVIVNDGFTTVERSTEVTIVKINNSSIPAIKTDADASRLRVSLVEPDLDGEGDFSLQWQSQVPQEEWMDITDATTATYWLPADRNQRIRYRAIDISYTDGQGYKTEYDNQGPFPGAIEAIDEIGGEARADEGETLVLTAPTVSGGSEVYSYEWTYSAEDSMHLSGKSELVLTGTDATTLNVVIPTDFIALDPESTTFTFKVIVNDGFTTVERSTEVTIVKINNSSSPAIKTDADASRLSVSLVEPDLDGEGDFSLQWQSQVPQEGWTDITNATTATYWLPANADDSRIRYRAIGISYTDGQGYVASYDDQGPFPGAIESTSEIGGDAQADEGKTLALTAPTVRGGSEVYNYEWTYSAEDSTHLSGKSELVLTGSTATTLNVVIPTDFIALVPASTRFTFKVVVNDGFTTVERSKEVTIAKINNSSIPAIKTDADASRLRVSLIEPDLDGEGDFSLQWQSQVPEEEWMNITGATTATYSLPASADDSRIRYRAIDISYTDGQGYKTEYDDQGPFPGAIEATDEIGGDAQADEGETLVLTAPTVSGGSEVYSYEWTYSAEDSMHLSGKSELAVTGTDAATLNVTIPADFIALDPESTTFTFKVIVNDGFTTVERSTEVTIVKIENGSSAIKTDADASRLRVSLVEPDVDGEGDFSLQWQSQMPEEEWMNITGATTATYRLPARADGSRIRYRAIDIIYTDAQGYVENYDNQGPFPGAIEATDEIGGDAQADEGETLVLTAPTVSGGSEVYSYEWTYSAEDSMHLSGKSELAVTGTDAATLNVVIPTDFIALDPESTKFTFKVIVNDGFTTVERSTEVTIVKINNSSIPAIKTDADASRLRVSLVEPDLDGEGDFSLQWQSQVPQEGWMNITGATTATYRLPANADGSRIRYRAIGISYTDGQGYETKYDNQGPFPGAIEATGEIGGGDTQTNEGETLVLTAPTVSDGSEVYSYEWTYSAEDSMHLSGKSELVLTGTTATTLNVTIPADFIALVPAATKFTFKVVVNDGFTTVERSKEVTIAKRNNGSSPAIKTDADASRLRVSLIEPDVDGEGDFSLQWQSQVPEEEWMNITDATTATYWLPANRNQRIRYRAIGISYTDGQGYVASYDDQGPFPGAIESTSEIGGEARADEGETLALTAPTVSGGSEVYSYAWTYSEEDSTHLSGKSELVLTGMTATTLNVTIPADFIALDPESTTFTFKVVVNDGFTTVERSTEVTIVKIENGSSAIKTDADASRLRVSLVEPDVDGEGDFSLQWQSQMPEEEWMNITGATTATYRLPARADGSRIRYRAIDIIYTDAQGYVENYDNQGPFPGAIEATDEIGGDAQADEGKTLVLTAPTVSGGSEVYSYAWTYSAEDSMHLSGKSELAVTGTTATTLNVAIPVDFIASATTSTKFTFKVVVNDGFTTVEQSKVVTIIKIDNGAPAIDFVETTKTLTVIVGSDPDGETSTTYHWEQRILPEENWTTITSAITATYQLPEVPDGSILYRVNVSHTDGQGYVTTVTGGPFKPSAVAGLIALDISASAILIPKFASNIFTYLLKVAVYANELSLTPTASTGSIVYSVNGGAEQAVTSGQPFTVALTDEIQTLTITVELQDGSFKSAVYTISKIERVIFTNIRLFLEGLLP